MDMPSQTEVNALIRQIQSHSFYNRQLSRICHLNRLKSTGVKAELQSRIVSEIQLAINSSDRPRYDNIMRTIQTELLPQSSLSRQATTASSTGNSNTISPSTSLNPPLTNGQSLLPIQLAAVPITDRPMTYPTHQALLQGQILSSTVTSFAQPLTFKSSPFYRTLVRLGEVKTCEASQQRQSVSFVFGSQENSDIIRCSFDMTTHGIMLFCSGAPSGNQDISFPYQSELKVNGVEAKANLRGLKNKPGSTRPVDISSWFRFSPDAHNVIEFSWLQTNKRYYLGAYICKLTSVEELVLRVARGKKLTRQAVIREIATKAQDPDVVATSQVLSLKCPLSYVRLTLPCRSNSCTHLQCFDAKSYLQLQEQGPQWLCPICNKQAVFAQLVVDEYVQDILANTPDAVDQVTIEPNGDWTHSEPTSDDKFRRESSGETEFDGEDMVISEVTAIGGHFQSQTATPSRSVQSVGSQSVGTPGTTVSWDNSAMAKLSCKRPIAQVIDLTLSSDDETEQTARPNKRPAFSQIGSTSTKKTPHMP